MHSGCLVQLYTIFVGLRGHISRRTAVRWCSAAAELLRLVPLGEMVRTCRCCCCCCRCANANKKNLQFRHQRWPHRHDRATALLLWGFFASCRACAALSNEHVSRTALYPSRQQQQQRLRGSAADARGVLRESRVAAADDSSNNSSSNNSSTGGKGIPAEREHSTLPEQIHLALADARPRETYAMSVSWLTWVDARSQVFWGREAGALNEVVTGNTTSESKRTSESCFIERNVRCVDIIEMRIDSSYWYSCCGTEELSEYHTSRRAVCRASGAAVCLCLCSYDADEVHVHRERFYQ